MDPTKPTSCKVFRSCLVVRLRSVTTFVSWFSIAIVVVQAIFQHRRATSGWFDCPHRHPPITTDILRPSPTLNMAAQCRHIRPFLVVFRPTGSRTPSVNTANTLPCYPLSITIGGSHGHVTVSIFLWCVSKAHLVLVYPNGHFVSTNPCPFHPSVSVSTQPT